MTAAAIAPAVRWSGQPVRRPAPRPKPFAIKMLLVYLGAITIIGKGPTYLGIPPLYWGEIVMLILVAWIIRNPLPLYANVAKLPILSGAIVVFMLIGAVLTARDVSKWGLDAVRDAALWYYATFFFIGLYITRSEKLSDAIWKTLMVIWSCAVIWGSMDLASGNQLSNLGPIIPWRGVGVLTNIGHELGQNMALGSAILLGGYTLPKFKSAALRTVLGLAGFTLFAASHGRGQKVGVAMGLLAVLILSFGRRRPPQFPRRLVCLVTICAVLGVSLATVAGVDFGKVTQLDRFLEQDSADAGTHYWRTIWWHNLNRAVLDTNPLFGLGFGLNLCVFNPFLVGTEDLQWVARSPHNINMTMYSRMGIVGASLWGLILLLGVGRLFWHAWHGTNGRHPYTLARREELCFWVMMLITTVVNSSFGVLMEGPVLGIWFWFALGFASGRSMATVPASALRNRALIRQRMNALRTELDMVTAV